MFDERKYALLVEGLASKAWQRLPVGAYDDEEHARSAASEVVDEYRSHTMTFMEAASILDLSNNSEAGFVAGLQSVVRPDHTKSFVLDAAEAALVEDVALAVLDIYAPGAQEEPVSTLEEDIEAAEALLPRDTPTKGRALQNILDLVRVEDGEDGHPLYMAIRVKDSEALLNWIRCNGCLEGVEDFESERVALAPDGEERLTPRCAADWNDLYEVSALYTTDWFNQWVWNWLGRPHLRERGRDYADGCSAPGVCFFED